MQIIKDIRLYKSDIENIDGNSLPSEFMTKENNIVICRIVMKLREYGLVLGEFHHLYINFTVCVPPDTIQFSKRSIDPYYKWYRYVDFGVKEEDFNKLDTYSAEYFAEKVKTVLCEMFVKNDSDLENIKNCITVTLRDKEKTCAKYKEKKSAKLTAVIYLRIDNNGYNFPLLVVTQNISGREILRKDLPLTHTFHQYGTIQLSNKRVQINPRKNSFSSDLKPIIFEF